MLERLTTLLLLTLLAVLTFNVTYYSWHRDSDGMVYTYHNSSNIVSGINIFYQNNRPYSYSFPTTLIEQHLGVHGYGG